MEKLNNFFARLGNWFKELFVNPKPKFKKLIQNDKFNTISASMIAIVIGLIFGLLLMMATNIREAFPGFIKVLLGGLNASNPAFGVGETLYVMMPLLMTGLSVGVAFKTGLFNIGAPGQYTMGMFVALYSANVLHLSWIFCVLLALLSGALWGAIPGLFKAFFNVNEVITSIMSNYIGLYLVDMLIKGNPLLFANIEQRTIPVSGISSIPDIGLGALFSGSRVNVAILIGIVIAIILAIVMNKTTFGYELKACGLNKNAARYAGINEKKSIVLSMVIAGSLAAIGGAFFILSAASTYDPTNTLAAMGFNGIPVALLGASNPVAIIFSAFFISHIQRGGFYLQILDFKPEIIDIIIGVIIYFSGAALLIKALVARGTIKMFKDKEPKAISDKPIDVEAKK